MADPRDLYHQQVIDDLVQDPIVADAPDRRHDIFVAAWEVARMEHTLAAVCIPESLERIQVRSAAG